MRPRPIRIAGVKPARKRPAIETLPTAPYTTEVMLGGTRQAMVEAAAISAAMNGRP